MSIVWNKVTWYSKLLAVIVLAGAIWLGFYFNSEFKKVEEIKPVLQADIDTVNWKTYRNEKYGFEVKYPNGYKVIETENQTYFMEDRIIEGATDGWAINSINIGHKELDTKNGIEVSDFQASLFKTYADIYEFNSNPSELNNINASHKAKFKSDVIAFNQVGYSFVRNFFALNPIAFTVVSYDRDRDRELLKGVVESFKFIDRAVVWKLYKGTHYPNDWGVEELKDSVSAADESLYVSGYAFSPLKNFMKNSPDKIFNGGKKITLCSDVQGATKCADKGNGGPNVYYTYSNDPYVLKVFDLMMKKNNVTNY